MTFLCLIAMASCQLDRQMKVSIFDDHIISLSRLDSISFAEAAAKVRGLGYDGVDVKYTLSQERLNTLDSLGFKHACLIVTINLSQSDQKDEQDKAFDYAVRNHFDKIMLVPGIMPVGYTEQHMDTVATRIEKFYERAKSLGFTMVLEDYDNERSALYNKERLAYMFERMPELGCAFDFGNFLFAGDDVMEAYDAFKNRIKHVHLKDRVKIKDRLVPAVGTGIAPMKEVITDLRANGYDGWFVVELYGSRNLREDIVTSIKNVREFEKLKP